MPARAAHTRMSSRIKRSMEGDTLASNSQQSLGNDYKLFRRDLLNSYVIEVKESDEVPMFVSDEVSCSPLPIDKVPGPVSRSLTTCRILMAVLAVCTLSTSLFLAAGGVGSSGTVEEEHFVCISLFGIEIFHFF
ncbi:KaiB-like protein 2 [Frankliniella fusca]|uniref:KaiB-like protein 2 n=1 Tax=Frankliniella fusca TaxID=407009 RepID=A0AAE1HUY8_9NEOP|nr:KaiB-like protein 2 [Frankliniella fusca]